MDRSTETEMKVYREHIQSLNRQVTFQGLELTKLNRAIRRRNNKIKNLRAVIGKLKAELQQEGAIYAPWGDTIVEALNWWQLNDRRHPFTCPNRSDGAHDGEGVLIATNDGWRCPNCSYTQTWAHAFMTKRRETP